MHLTSRVLRTPRDDSPVALLVFCVATVAGLAVLRGVFAATVDLRVDEAYYWTWSKESVISYLDHPPVIAWCIRVGTQLFGDTNFGVRFPGLAAMLCMQLLLADIVRRLVRDDFLGQQFLLVGLLLLPIVLIGTGMMAIRGYRSLAPVPILLSTAVIFPIGFFLWHGFDSRVGDSWLLFAWPLGFLCATINLQQWHAESRSLLARIAPAVMMFAIASGIAVVVTTEFYYVAGTANYFRNDDPIGKEAGFAALVADAEAPRKLAGAAWFITSDYRIYSMLRWHLKDAVPVVQLNERSRYIGFLAPQLDGPVGLYVAPQVNRHAALWDKTSAVLETVAGAFLVWRSFQYDAYTFKRLTGWKPAPSSAPGDPLYFASPN